jgi:hypothetical protein
MKTLVVFTLWLALICMSGCTGETIPIIEKGDFEMTIDGKPWAPKSFTAVWYSNYNDLYIVAHDAFGRFNLGVNLDSNNTLKTYLLEANSSNSASLAQSGPFSSDNNTADIGGKFSLQSFDKAAKQVSCSFQFNAFSDDNKTKSVISASLVNLPLTIDSSRDEGNSMECTVKGVNTGTWRSREWLAFPQCGNSLEIRFQSLGGYRYLYFRIPFSKGTGTYSVLPAYLPYSLCNSDSIISSYVANSYANPYFPVSGTITITKMDAAAKKLEADFNLICKDASNPQQTVQLTNGKLRLNTWK